ncbi:MAG TPA: gluconeogenesis factor YvcK family protein [Longimicrobiales bacterium]|nr:gluconeogenesis factor YvcK family protein [Longimicrobiales bacterium]
MRLRTLRVGCFGGGTGLPSLLGGLRAVPWLDLNAIVTMFDSGGSSGQLRDELGVLPPGDILKCALALARNEREARRLLLSRLPSLEHARLRGHTGGNLLLSMMAQYSGDFAAAVDGLQSLLGCVGRVWPISTEPATVCAEYLDGNVIRGEVEVDENQLLGRPVHRVWLEPEVDIHPAAAAVIASFDAAIIGPGSFYTSLMPILLVRGAREAFASVKGPVVFVANLLSEGQGMDGMTAAGAAAILEAAIGRPVDVIVFNTGRPTDEALRRYAEERKTPLELGDVPPGCEVVTGDFWRGDIARHDRRRLGTAVWAALAGRLLTET